MRLRVGHQHSWFFFDSGPFHALLHTVLGSQSDFQRLTIPGVRLCVHRQHSQFWPILTRFVDYYSPFCGPEAISIVVEPQVEVMCRSSTLAVLADSGPFRGLLLTILGPKRFPRLTNPEVRLRVGHQHSWSLSILIRFMHYYVPFLGPRVISTIDDPGGAFR